jgi:predicted DNA-binding transcriptional regulator YafY
MARGRESLLGNQKTRPPYERMLRIHEAIKSGKYPNCRSLAKEFEVNEKSIQRDLYFMRDRLRLPLEYHPLKWGYYYTQEVEAFPAIQISEGELLALLVAEKSMEQYRGTPFEKPLVSAFQKLTAGLPATISISLADWNKTISFRSSAESLMNLKVMDVLAKATAKHVQIEIVYRKPGQSAPEKRVVDPYHLANINGEWFLFAFDHLRKAIRTFAAVRIKSARLTNKTFVPSQRFSIEETLRGSFGVVSGRGAYDVVIRFDPSVADYIREKRWHPSQKLKELPQGAVEIRLRLSSLTEVERWILSWGGNAVPIKPPELVKNVKAAAKRMLEGRRNGR